MLQNLVHLIEAATAAFAAVSWSAAVVLGRTLIRGDTSEARSTRFLMASKWAIRAAAFTGCAALAEAVGALLSVVHLS